MAHLIPDILYVRFIASIVDFSTIIRRLTAQCVSFNHKAPYPNFGLLKNQEKISQFSTAPDQLPNMRHQFYSKELLNLVFNPSS